MLRDDAHLILVVGNDFSKFLLDVLGLDGLSTDARQDVSSSVELSLDNEISRGLWEKEETSSENDSGNQLDRDWDSVRAAVETVLGGIGNTGRCQQAKSDGKLVTGNESATNLARCDFGHVENNNSGNEADTWQSVSI
jgi:hypothetical protein